MLPDALLPAARVVVVALGATCLSACANSPDAEPIPGMDASQGAGGARPDGAVPGARDAAVDERSRVDVEALDASNDASVGPGDARDDHVSASDALDAPRGDAPSDVASGDGSDAAACGCASYGAPSATGILPASLVELSGVVASRRHPGVLYAHNDSGAVANVVAFSDTAAPLGEIVLSNVTAIDWEDIAVGPCAAGSCVYVGDIGDNALAYPSRAVYRFAEPDISPSTPIGSVMVTAEAFPYVYPDDRHNAETLLVEPKTGDIFIVTKISDMQSTVYRMPQPLTPGVQATLERVGTLSLPAAAGLVVGGDVNPCGTRMLVRTYLQVYEFSLPVGQPFASIFATTARPVPTPTNEQESKGKGVTYAADGFGYFTASELDGKVSRSLYRVRCP